MIAALTPNPSIDRFFLVADEVRVGQIHRPSELVTTAGGKGLNAARAASALGGDVRAVALLAGHAGRWIADELLEHAIRADVVWTTGETRSSLSAADPSSGRPTEFYERGEVTDPAAWERFLERVSALTGARWAAIAGSLPPGIAASGSAELVERSRAVGARVVVDQRGPALTAAIEAAPDVAKLRAADARELTGHSDPREAVRSLHATLAERRAAAGLDGPAAVVTAGEDGAFLVTPEGTALHGAIDVRGPFPSGSGDAFLGGLLVALDAGERYADALPLALGAATANAERAGAGKLDPRRAQALAAQAVVRPA